jgi:hypothetical protein
MRLSGGRSMAFTIESMALKMLVFSGTKVEKWLTVPLKPNSVREGLIAKPDAVGEALAEAIEKNSLPRSGVVAAVPSSGASAQILNLPAIKKGNLKDMVEREIARTMASALDTDFVHWVPLVGDGVQKQNRVYVVSVPRSAVVNVAEACRAANVGLKGVELKPFALFRAVNCRAGIIVHGEIDQIEIVVVDRTFPRLFRSVPVKEAAPTPQIAARYLVRELPFTIDYYNRTFRETQLSPDAPVYLSGELAQDAGLAQEAAKVTGGEVAAVPKPATYPADFPLGPYLSTVGLMLRKKW